jgi:hypothetical protein
MKPTHQQLQKAYIAEMREAMRVSIAWWQSLVKTELKGSALGAEAEARRRWPDGAASHPRVVGVIVKYMHACEALNAGKPRTEQESVNHFLIEGLDTRESQDLNDFTDDLSYWPISRDENGNRV